MSSNTIYQHTAGDRTPYTYLIGWSYANLYYYGRRTAKGCHPEDLWNTYFTSSKEVEQLRMEGEPDIVEIRYIFDSVDKCRDMEDRVLKYTNAAKLYNWLNRSNGGRNFYGDKEAAKKGAATRRKNGTDILGAQKATDTKRKSGAYIELGIKMSEIRKIKYWAVNLGITNEMRIAEGKHPLPGKPKGSKDKDPIASGEKRRQHRLGKATYRMSNGECLILAKDDPLVLDGIAISVMTGVPRTPHSEETKAKFRAIAQARTAQKCAVCNRSIKGNMNWNRHLVSRAHLSKITDQSSLASLAK